VTYLQFRFSTAGWLALTVAAALPTTAVAQDAVRVVEAVSEATGNRQRYVVRDLDEAEIKAVQAALREEGYIGIGWTGRLDDGTVDGLRRFQRERGLVECGCISYETIVALGLRPEVVATFPADPVPVAGGGYVSGYGSSVSSGIYYPVGIPIYIPRPPPCEDDPCDGNGGGNGGGDGSHLTIGNPGASGSNGSGMTAVPPGIRPAPPTPRSSN
jgi:hypothetical protein